MSKSPRTVKVAQETKVITKQQRRQGLCYQSGSVCIRRRRKLRNKMVPMESTKAMKNGREAHCRLKFNLKPHLSDKRLMRSPTRTHTYTHTHTLPFAANCCKACADFGKLKFTLYFIIFFISSFSFQSPDNFHKF